MEKPIVKEIEYRDAFELFQPFSKDEGALFLDSSSHANNQGRYSFISSQPCEAIQVESILDFEYVQDRMRSLKRPRIADLPPFQGGMAGFFAYEMQHIFEELPHQQKDDMATPMGMLGVYETVIALDHKLRKAWVFAPHSAQIEEALSKIETYDKKKSSYEGIQPKWVADFTKDEYQDQVQNVINYILNGDIFQANLTQKYRASLPSDFDPLSFYGNLRKINPAPYSAFLNMCDVQIACSSPERFLKLDKFEVTTNPIKGTRPKGSTAYEDEQLIAELLNSGKDWAENTMIVDLLRNDLSRVCMPHSVKVGELCKLYSFATVHHLISQVSGQISATMDGFDLIRATFPGGSITGAPKVRAMEIITEIEKNQRGPYCGSIGYMDFSGDMEFNILIRSILFKNQTACVQVGGGIVADSTPKEEYQEINDKAHALFQSFERVFE